MAETARRMVHGHGSDVVRRLIARPIRMQAARPAQPVVAESARPAEIAQAAAAETSLKTTSLPSVEKMQAELLVMKAVLRAERRENENLRACLGFDEADAPLGAEAQAMRDRWAGLVDRLLRAPA